MSVYKTGSVNGMTWHATYNYYWVIKLCKGSTMYSFTFDKDETVAKGRNVLKIDRFEVPVEVLRDICRGKKPLEALQEYEG